MISKWQLSIFVVKWNTNHSAVLSRVSINPQTYFICNLFSLLERVCLNFLLILKRYIIILVRLVGKLDKHM